MNKRELDMCCFSVTALVIKPVLCKPRRWFLVVLLSLASFSVHAVDRALLIATTSYEDPIHNLPGIELDLQAMERFTRKLGFESENIKTLQGAQVTVENIEQSFAGFLTADVAAEDSLLIYYSGHGMQVPDRNGDEEDRRDEAISMYNLTPAVAGWEGILVDDQFAALLRTLPSENVVVIVDACHSGTVTRSFQPAFPSTTKAFTADEFVVKALPFRGRESEARGFVKSPGSITDEIPAGVVSLSASQDNELSLASVQGSLFTLALSQTLEAQRKDASPQSLVTGATSILDAQLNKDLLFLPNLSGDERLYKKRLMLDEKSESVKVNWPELQQLAGTLASMEMVGTQSVYANDEPIEIIVKVPADGYLNIVAVDAHDDMVLLYPNALEQENRIEAGPHVFPGARDFSWIVQPPWGDTLMVAFFSSEPINLFASSTQRQVDGKPTADYVLPSLAGFADIKTQRGVSAGSALLLQTCHTSKACQP